MKINVKISGLLFAFIKLNFKRLTINYAGDKRVISEQLKKVLLTIAGVFFISLGLIFILLPGPAVICIPLGLALLAMEYPWAKVWLRKAQRSLRKSAVASDKLMAKFKRKFIS